MAYEVYYGLVEEEGAVPAEHQVRQRRGQGCDRLGTRPPRALEALLHSSFIQVEVEVWWLAPNALSLSFQVEMATARDLGEVTVIGSLLLQHLLHFSSPSLVLRSLGALTGPQLLTLAQSPAGSHVLDAVLASPAVTRKQRRRVLKTLKVRVSWLLKTLITLPSSF